MSLYLAIGGGGDVIMATVLAGDEAVGQIPWERFVVDPEPGPVPLSNFADVVPAGDGVALVTPRSYVERNGRRFKTQGVCVSQLLEKSIYVVDSYTPPSKLAKSLAVFNKVVGVDVGGDVLGVGCEKELGSPLADGYGAAVLAKLRDLGVETEIVVMSPGADGELEREYLLKRAALAAELGGFLGSIGLSKRQIELLSRLTEHCVTEASAVAVKAARGVWGRVPIRGGQRTVEVDLFSTVGFRFDPHVLLRINKAARLIYERDLPIDQAAEALLSVGIPTEWHLEELLKNGVKHGEAIAILRKGKKCLEES